MNKEMEINRKQMEILKLKSTLTEIKTILKDSIMNLRWQKKFGELGNRNYEVHRRENGIKKMKKTRKIKSINNGRIRKRDKHVEKIFESK